ncbi:MAG: 16S rRNA processing protein RimM [Spirochaetes bacterium]|nr:16S rRNA processing protein RimM [Spirochaetota bacterium]
MNEESRFLRIAKITGAHGLNGRLKLAIITDFIERFEPGNVLFIKTANEFKPFLSAEFIDNSNNSLIKFENINDRDAALSLKGAEIYITRSEAEKTRNQLESDSFYFYDLIGCRVFMNGSLFGMVVDIMGSGENVILVLNDDKGKEFLIPFIQSMVDTEHIFDGRIDISPIEGLFDLEE